MLKAQKPFFSVIIPTCNRHEQLKTCLKAVSDLDYPKYLFEVIIVDDGSKESPESVVKGFEDQLDIMLVRQENAGPAAARNAGAAHAGGKILVFTDDDCPPGTDWLIKLEKRFSETSDHLIGGRTFNALRDNVYAAASQIIFDLVYHYYNPDPEHARFIGAANLSVSAEHFRSMGGFNPNFTTAEDREFCDRWLNRGYRIIHAPEAAVYHSHALTFRKFCKQHFDYGRGAFRYQRIRALRKTGGMRSDLKFHISLPLLLRKHISELPPRQAIIVALLLPVWEIANAAGFFYEKFRLGLYTVHRHREVQEIPSVSNYR